MLQSGVRALPLGSDFPTAGEVNNWYGFAAAISRQNASGFPAGGLHPEEKV